MESLAKTGATAVIALAIGAGGATAAQGTELTVQKQLAEQATSQKHEVLKQYIYAQARLNEEPVLNTATASSEEMVAAYVAIANEKGATEKENLFEGLSDKAKQDGVSCVPL